MWAKSGKCGKKVIKCGKSGIRGQRAVKVVKSGKSCTKW